VNDAATCSANLLTPHPEFFLELFPASSASFATNFYSRYPLLFSTTHLPLYNTSNTQPSRWASLLVRPFATLAPFPVLFRFPELDPAPEECRRRHMALPSHWLSKRGQAALRLPCLAMGDVALREPPILLRCRVRKPLAPGPDRCVIFRGANRITSRRARPRSRRIAQQSERHGNPQQHVNPAVAAC